MKTTSIGFIGGGRITKIFLQAFQNKALDLDSVLVYEPNTDTASALKKQFPQIDIAETPEEPAGQGIVFLAVHPPMMMETLANIKAAITADSIIVSLAPKISMEKMAAALPSEKLVRMIPNATSFINKGYNPVAFHNSVNEEEIQSLLQLFGILGKTMEVEESMLEGYAVVSAMLPTYFWFQWKKMEEIAMKTGFSETDAKKVIKDTLSRSIKLYYKSDLTPEEVIDLIPVKPIGENEEQIEQILETKLLGLFDKIKP